MNDSKTSPMNGTNKSSKTPKRKVIQDIESCIKRCSKRVQKGPKSYEVREILKTDSFKFCQDLGLLAKSVKCYCNEEMKLTTNYPSKGALDPYLWRCRKNKHNTKLSIRRNTFFENSKLSINDFLWLMYMWVYDYSMASMLHEADNAYHTILSIHQACERVCRETLESRNDPVGGDQKTIEIFECSLTEEDLKDASPEAWVFGGIELRSTNTLLVIMVDKSPETIVKMLEKWVLPGSTLASYNWPAFKNLTVYDFELLKNARLLNFYDLWTKKDIVTYSDFVDVAGQPMQGTYYWHKAVYEGSFFTKMYKRSLLNAQDAYTTFLKDVAMLYKPCDKYVKSADKVTDQSAD